MYESLIPFGFQPLPSLLHQGRRAYEGKQKTQLQRDVADEQCLRRWGNHLSKATLLALYTSCFGLSRNLLWPRFCLLLYSTAVLNLNRSLVLKSGLSIRSFHNWKEPKGSGTRKISRLPLCSGVAEATSLGRSNLAVQSFSLMPWGFNNRAVLRCKNSTAYRTEFQPTSRTSTGLTCDFTQCRFYFWITIVRARYSLRPCGL